MDDENTMNLSEASNNENRRIFHIFDNSKKIDFENSIVYHIDEESRRRHAVDMKQQRNEWPFSNRQRIRLTMLYYFRRENVARLIFVTLCFIWFMYNFIIIFKEFINFDTIVYMEYRPANLTRPPAITFCSHGSNFPPKIVESLNISDFLKYCRLYPNTLPKTKISQLEYRKCSDLTSPLTIISENHKCFTLFNGVFGSDKVNKMVKMNFDLFPYIEIAIKGKYLQSPASSSINNHPDFRESPGIFLVLHSPTIFPDMYSLSYHRVFPKKLMQIHFSKLVEIRKSWPYKTNCFPYDADNVQRPELKDFSLFNSNDSNLNNLAMFRSRGECFIYCMWRSLGHGNCLNSYTIFTQHLYTLEKRFRIARKLKEEINFEKFPDQSIEDRIRNLNKFQMDFCPIKNDSYSYYNHVKQNCLKQCLTECSAETFWIDTSYNLDMNSRYNDSLVRLEWSTQPVVFIKHKSKLTTPGFLGNLGGHAHIWLGVSIFTIGRYLIKLLKTPSSRSSIYCNRFCLKKWFHRVNVDYDSS